MTFRGGKSEYVIACAPSAGPTQCARSPVARDCDGRGVTWPSTASLLPVAPQGLLDAGDCSLMQGPRAVQVRPALRPGPGSRAATCVAYLTLWANGLLTLPVAASPRIGRNTGRWLQAQSESGSQAHGPDGDHGRRAEPGLRHGSITVSATSRPGASLALANESALITVWYGGPVDPPVNPCLRCKVRSCQHCVGRQTCRYNCS